MKKQSETKEFGEDRPQRVTTPPVVQEFGRDDGETTEEIGYDFEDPKNPDDEDGIRVLQSRWASRYVKEGQKEIEMTRTLDDITPWNDRF